MSTTTMAGRGPSADPRPMTKDERRVIFASSLGTVFEWYDFYPVSYTHLDVYKRQGLTQAQLGDLRHGFVRQGARAADLSLIHI